MSKTIFLLTLCLETFVSAVYAQEEVTISLGSLLNEMVNRDALSNNDGPSYQLMQTSSWDCAERNQNDSKSWFGNKDYDNYIRKETHGNRTEYVIMDAKGPGAITKWWIPESVLIGRTVRIYLDDNPEPVIEEPYEDLISGKSFVKWPFAFVSSDEKNAKYQYSMPVGLPRQVGNDFYLPIPFSKACKVTLDDSVFYYNIAYRLYKPGTKVLSFSKADYFKNIALVRSTGRKLLASIPLPSDAMAKKETIEQGKQITLDLPAGPHAITRIYLKINSKNNKQMNRSTVLQVIADSKTTVWSPVSEFFGGGVYARPVKNYNLEVTAGGWMICSFVMPYKTSAKIIIKNYGSQEVMAQLKAAVQNYKWDAGSMYFHAGWHEEAPLNAPPFKDWNYISINGKGRYVGDALTVYSVPHNWWGEGDEKIYIDNESFPSQLGTGLEDYYGYAWGMANYFNSPFISMPARDARGKDNWSGYTTVERMRLLDDIPFDSSLKVDMEAWITKAPVSFSVTCFWYGADAAVSNIKMDEATLLRKLPDFEGMKMKPLPGKSYPDPVANKSLIGKAKGTISYAGDQLDLINWQDSSVLKKYDPDQDNILGTDGYDIFGDRIAGMYGETRDSAGNLPAYIAGLEPGHINLQQGGTYLPVSRKKLVLHKTGLIEVSGEVAEKGLLSIRIGQNVPASFTLGIMLDNADLITKVGKCFWVTDSEGGNSGKVMLARSNRVPDWYFFKLRGLKKGDVVTVHGNTSPGGVFTIGAITFDQHTH
jgi:hypothetical protein